MKAPVTRGAAYAVVFLFALSFLLASGSYWLAVHAATQRSVIQLCQASNESRAQQVTLWEHLVVISRPPPHETRAARAQREETTRVFLAYVHKVFAPKNCAAAVKAGP